MLDYPSASRNAQSQIDLFNQRINGLNGYKIKKVPASVLVV